MTREEALKFKNDTIVPVSIGGINNLMFDLRKHINIIYDDFEKKETAINQAGFKLIEVENGYILVKGEQVEKEEDIKHFIYDKELEEEQC
ncbi:hypothetical protein [Sulfurimonas sp.]|uniref:hypothetical protein n=1 Tax=Sulfurimonas sp. TaxID=2022749 RepID=UPI003D149827